VGDTEEEGEDKEEGEAHDAVPVVLCDGENVGDEVGESDRVSLEGEAPEDVDPEKLPPQPLLGVGVEECEADLVEVGVREEEEVEDAVREFLVVSDGD